MRIMLFKLHLYGALIIGLFVAFIGATGSIMAFEDDLDRLFNPRLFTVAPQGDPLPVSALLQAAAAAYPGQKINTIRLPQSSTDSAMFMVRGPRQVFLNPYDGRILGERSPVTILSRIHSLHLRLMAGEIGSDIVAGVTGALLLLVATGIYLWWPLKRVKVKWNGGARRVNFDLHHAVGIFSAAFLLILGLTGIVVHFDNSLERYLHQAAGTSKIVKNAPSTVIPGARPIAPEQAVESALAALPGARVLSVSLPANVRASYLIALRYPEDLTPGGRSWANVDQYSGKVVNLQSSRAVAAGTRIIILNRAVHTGDIFGYPSKILAALASLMLVTQAATGYYLWWKKSQPGNRSRQANRVQDESSRAHP